MILQTYKQYYHGDSSPFVLRTKSTTRIPLALKSGLSCSTIYIYIYLYIHIFIPQLIICIYVSISYMYIYIIPCVIRFKINEIWSDYCYARTKLKPATFEWFVWPYFVPEDDKWSETYAWTIFRHFCERWFSLEVSEKENCR